MIDAAAVHWPVTCDNEPRPFSFIFRLVCLFQICFQPFKLIVNLHRAILCEVVKLTTERHYMHWTNVEAVKVIVYTATLLVNHRKT